MKTAIRHQQITKIEPFFKLTNAVLKMHIKNKTFCIFSSKCKLLLLETKCLTYIQCDFKEDSADSDIWKRDTA